MSGDDEVAKRLFYVFWRDSNRLLYLFLLNDITF